ncbi:hypothetical protein Tco_1072344 [Tanacetum coccineum]
MKLHSPLAVLFILFRDKLNSTMVSTPNEIDMDDLDPDDESIDRPLVTPFLDLDDDSDDGEVLNELEEYRNAGKTSGGISGVSNFTGRIKGMHIFVGYFTYISDFMIVKDISLIIDPRLSQVVLGKPFVEISNMIHDLSLGVVKFTGGTNEIAYKMPHKIEQYNSLSDLEKEHTKSIYLRNKEDKKRGVEYVMNKILGFYKEYLELGPEYLTGLEDEDGVT